MYLRKHTVAARQVSVRMQKIAIVSTYLYLYGIMLMCLEWWNVIEE
jgi:hypothetical protein